MAGPRGSAEATKLAILNAARELFAAHGVNAVTVRDVAAAAGVNHALVHRYFGTKEEMVAGIVDREIQAAIAVSPPEGSATAESLEGIRRLVSFYMTEGQTTLQLIMQAELAGVHPERLLHGKSRLIGMMAQWIAGEQAKLGADTSGLPDPALVSAVVGAAIFSFVNMAPWLMTSVGLEPDDYEKRRGEIIEILTGIVAQAAGVTRA